MKLKTDRYTSVRALWPQAGKHILAQYSETSVIVYQAYRPEIGEFAALKGFFGGAFSYSRMSWVKTNFLWMMYRSGWGTKPGQETTLAVELRRDFFDRILGLAVASSFSQSGLAEQDDWKQLVESSEVRLQWDPDHDPDGRPLVRRAIQLGLRGAILKQYGRDAIIRIEDISSFVAEQRANLKDKDALLVPYESCYPVGDCTTKQRLQI